jgi:hypothetical protein
MQILNLPLGSAISPAVKDKLKALAADDTGVSDFARRVLHKYLQQ